MSYSDVFEEDKNDDENERKIAENDYYNEMNKIANTAFNEGYLSTVDKNDETKYSEGFEKGVQYSLSFGKLFGLIEAFLLITSVASKPEQSDIDKITEIKIVLENFKEKLSDETISEYEKKIKEIINKYK